MPVEIRPSHFGELRKIESGGRHPPCKRVHQIAASFFIMRKSYTFSHNNPPKL